mmetsp:Transcript_16278/g.44840  ORF Transcript_16278/g.44840 Transcript_16278/m.44840 type:complete len:216 (+) Transcript_16278:116-763(+)
MRIRWSPWRSAGATTMSTPQVPVSWQQLCVRTAASPTLTWASSRRTTTPWKALPRLWKQTGRLSAGGRAGRRLWRLWRCRAPPAMPTSSASIQCGSYTGCCETAAMPGRPSASGLPGPSLSGGPQRLTPAARQRFGGVWCSYCSSSSGTTPLCHRKAPGFEPGTGVSLGAESHSASAASPAGELHGSSAASLGAERRSASTARPSGPRTATRPRA